MLLVIYRMLMRYSLTQLRRRGLGTTRALVVGSGAGAEALINRLEMFPEYGYELIGLVDDHLNDGEDYHRLPVIGSSRRCGSQRIIGFVLDHRPDGNAHRGQCVFEQLELA